MTRNEMGFLSFRFVFRFTGKLLQKIKDKNIFVFFGELIKFYFVEAMIILKSLMNSFSIGFQMFERLTGMVE